MKRILLIFLILTFFTLFMAASNSIHLKKPYCPIKNIDNTFVEIERIINYVSAPLPFNGKVEDNFSLLDLDSNCVNFNVENHIEDGGYVDFLFETTSCGYGYHTVDIRLFEDENYSVTAVQILVDGKSFNVVVGENCPQVSVKTGDGYLGLTLNFDNCDFCENLSGNVYLDIYYTEEDGTYTLEDIKYSFDNSFSPDLFFSCLNQEADCGNFILSDPYDESDNTYYRDLTISFENCGDNFPIEGNFTFTFQFENSGDRTYFKLVSEENNLSYLDPTEYIVNYITDNLCGEVTVNGEDTENGKTFVTIEADLDSGNCENSDYGFDLTGHLEIEYYVAGKYFDSFKSLNYVEKGNRYLEVNYDGYNWNIEFDETINFNGISELEGNYELIGSVTVNQDNTIEYDIYLKNIDNSDILFHFSSGEDDGLKFVNKSDYPYCGKSIFELPELKLFDSDNFKEYVKPIFAFDFSYGGIDEAEVKVVFHLKTVIGNFKFNSEIKKNFEVKLPQNSLHVIPFFNLFNLLNYDFE